MELMVPKGLAIISKLIKRTFTYECQMKNDVPEEISVKQRCFLIKEHSFRKESDLYDELREN